MKNGTYSLVVTSLFVTAIICSHWVAADDTPAAPKKADISELVTFKAITAEANDKIDMLTKALATPDAYEKASEEVAPRAAGVLACIAQAMVEHKDLSKSKIKPADLRVAALKLAELPDYDEAKAALAMANEAFAGHSSGQADAEQEWTELMSLDLLMKEINQREPRLSRGIRRMRKPDEVSQDASALAVLATVILANTDYYGDDADLGSQWRQFSIDMQNAMSNVAKSAEKKDEKGAQAFFVSARESCRSCHKAFEIED